MCPHANIHESLHTQSKAKKNAEAEEADKDGKDEEEEVGEDEEEEDGEDEEEEDGEDEEEDVTVSRKQRRSSHTRQKERRAKWQKIRARIPECMKKFKDLREEHTRADMYTFVRSVAQMYDRLNPQSGAELHVDRRSITSSAVTAVFSEGRADELPFDGDADVAVRVIKHVSSRK